MTPVVKSTCQLTSLESRLPCTYFDSFLSSQAENDHGSQRVQVGLNLSHQVVLEVTSLVTIGDYVTVGRCPYSAIYRPARVLINLQGLSTYMS